MTAGRHTVVRFSGTGAVLGSATLASTTTLHVATSARERIHGHTDSWLLIAGGARKGYWIRKSAPCVFVSGELVALSYTPSRTLDLPAGRHTLHDYSSSGAVTSTMVLSASGPPTLPVDARAVVDGVVQVQAQPASSPGPGSVSRAAACSDGLARDFDQLRAADILPTRRLATAGHGSALGRRNALRIVAQCSTIAHSQR